MSADRTQCKLQILRLSGFGKFPDPRDDINKPRFRDLVNTLERVSRDDAQAERVITEIISSGGEFCPQAADIARVAAGIQQREAPKDAWKRLPDCDCRGTGFRTTSRTIGGVAYEGSERCPCGAVPALTQEAQ